jgi:hypothetical protein
MQPRFVMPTNYEDFVFSDGTYFHFLGLSRSLIRGQRLLSRKSANSLGSRTSITFYKRLYAADLDSLVFDLFSLGDCEIVGW